MTLAQKFIAIADAAIEHKAGDEGGPTRVAGYASCFGGQPDAYGDLIEQGAYAKTIAAWGKKSYRLPMLLDHFSAPIGIWDKLEERTKGLWVEGELTPGHSLANDTSASLKHGAISGLSIGYRPVKFTIDQKTGNRTLSEIELGEISIVGRPAQERARVERVKSIDECVTIREFEAWLRDSGLSRREAAALSEGGFKGLLRARGEPVPGETADERRDDGKAAVRLGVLAELRSIRPQFIPQS